MKNDTENNLLKIPSRKKIAITGGPSGGKTTLIEMLQKDLGHQIVTVPEAATILYKGGFPRRKGSIRQKHAQRAIYFTQFELESIFEEESPNKMIICDRGSIDGLAYWPGSEEDFFQFMKSSRRDEYKRYDFIIHLDTASQDHYDTENPIRTETFNEAIEVNRKILQAWDGHPQRFIIPHHNEFFEKMKISIQIVKLILNGLTFSEINAQNNFS